MDELGTQIRTFNTIKDVLPKLIVLADALESVVLGAAVIVLQAELSAIQARWAGQSVTGVDLHQSLTKTLNEYIRRMNAI